MKRCRPERRPTSARACPAIALPVSTQCSKKYPVQADFQAVRFGDLLACQPRGAGGLIGVDERKCLALEIKGRDQGLEPSFRELLAGLARANGSDPGQSVVGLAAPTRQGLEGRGVLRRHSVEGATSFDVGPGERDQSQGELPEAIGE